MSVYRTIGPLVFKVGQKDVTVTLIFRTDMPCVDFKILGNCTTPVIPVTRERLLPTNILCNVCGQAGTPLLAVNVRIATCRYNVLVIKLPFKSLFCIAKLGVTVLYCTLFCSEHLLLMFFRTVSTDEAACPFHKLII